MISFKEFFSRKLLFESSGGLLFEHEIYKIIPRTKNSYRRDAGTPAHSRNSIATFTPSQRVAAKNSIL